MRAATASSDSTPRARFIRRSCADEICHNGDGGTLRALKQQRRAPGFHAAVRDFRDLEHGVHFGRNALKFAFFFERAQKLPQVAISHFPSLIGQKIASFEQLTLARVRARGPRSRTHPDAACIPALEDVLSPRSGTGNIFLMKGASL